MLKGRPKGGSAEKKRKKKKGQLNKYCMQTETLQGLLFPAQYVGQVQEQTVGEYIHGPASWESPWVVELADAVRGHTHHLPHVGGTVGYVTRCKSPPPQAIYYPPAPSHALCRSSLGFKSTVFLLTLSTPHPCPTALHWSLAGPISSMLPTAGLELTAILPQPPKCRILRPF